MPVKYWRLSSERPAYRMAEEMAEDVIPLKRDTFGGSAEPSLSGPIVLVSVQAEFERTSARPRAVEARSHGASMDSELKNSPSYSSFISVHLVSVITRAI